MIDAKSLAAVKSLLLAVFCLSPGCGSGTEQTQPQQMVFVDTKTQIAVVGPVTDQFPALNKETGKRTLMPGLYCPKCEKWYPVPSPDQINHRPDGGLCPKTKTPLIADGPMPSATLSGIKRES